MDVREKLVELLGKVQQMGVIYRENQMDERYPSIEQIRNTEVAARLIANGVTVQEWISVKDRLPEENYDGSVNAVLVTDGLVQHIAYFARGEWRFAESGEIKEPMWYSITHWMPLPEPPKGE